MEVQPSYYLTLYLTATRVMTFDLPAWFTPVQNNKDLQWHAAVRIFQEVLETAVAAAWTV